MLQFARTTIHNTNVDLVNDNVYTKFCPILSLHFQDIERKPKNYAGMTEREREREREKERMTERQTG